KITCYIVSALAIFSVFAIMFGWFESSSIGFELGIAYATLSLAVSAVLVPAIGNAMNNQTKVLNIVLISLSVLSTLVNWIYFSADFSTIYSIIVSMGTLYFWGLTSFTFYNLVVSNLKLWPFIGLILICFIFALVFTSWEEIPLRDGNVLSAIGSKIVSAGLFMFYALILAATCIMVFFGLKNMKK
ncbi:hypothetical protein N8383_02315, partial [Flavobacteriaceae bacterium]|nr:hypothetical protein [Flavobacteriaceae bacterium]